ncbi:MAG: transposase [Endomicrobia bacterium]|nr:transposase [Endomicrobiia bacterium]
MARMARKHLDGKYFHVMVQGIGKETIFPDDNSKGYYLSTMSEAKIDNKIFIFAFCVMDNHAHILIKAEKIKDISLFMKEVNTEYARYYNTTRKRIGYVFRGRFKSEVIDDEKYLINCIAYIHNNPVKAKLENDAKEYKYSSYKNYISHSGIIDFEEAKKYYDISPSNIEAIMEEKSHSEWLEHDDRKYEESEDVLEELVKKYNISTNRVNYDLAVKISKELIERSGISLRRCAEILGVQRERLRLAFLEMRE